MSITTYLEQILSARYGKDVRQSIHDAIEEGYNIAVQAQGTAETSQESAEAYAAAALASEQAAQGYMELAEQYKNEAFSGTPTGYSDLVAKVNSIYKETASSFGIVGTVEGLALAHTIYGMSEQDGTPTPSVPVDIDSAVANFKIFNKNLVHLPFFVSDSTSQDIDITVNNDKGCIVLNGTASGKFDLVINTRTQALSIPAGTYKVGFICNSGSANTTSGIMALTLRAYKYTNTSNPNVDLIYRSYSQAISTPSQIIIDEIDYTESNRKEYPYIGFFLTIYSGGVYNNLEIYPVLMLSDTNSNDYVLPQSTSITTDLTLRAIEVESTDDYNLVKDGKYYIADTLDWHEDSGYSITRRIGYTKLSDTSIALTNSAWGGSNTAAAYGFADGTLTNMKSYANDSAIAPILSDISVASSRNLMYDSDSKNGHHYYGTWGFTILITSGLYTTTEAFLSAFGDNYIQYPLATPTSESVTSAQAQAILGLKTFDEATSIDATGDVAPSVTLEYSKDRNTALGLMSHNMAHINALKIADLSA